MIVAIALASPAWAQDGVNAAPISSPNSGPATGSGTVGNSIRIEPENSAPPAAPAPQAAASSDDSGGDSISVTGGVPGAPPSAPASDTNGGGSQAQPAVATAPAEAPPSAPAVAIAPTAAAPESTPETTAATAPPAGAIAPPMTLAPVPAEVPASEPPATSAAAAPAQPVAPQKAPKAAAGHEGETKLASNPPQQTGAFGMQFGNSKAPIDIKSASMSLDYQNHSVLWVGNVRATQADAQLTSDQLRVNYFDKDFKQMKDMVADGNVRLSQGTRWATGKHGVMDQTNRTVVLTGSPVAHDGNDQITGCKITVYLNTNQSVVDCAHAVLFPHSEASPGASATPAAATD